MGGEKLENRMDEATEIEAGAAPDAEAAVASDAETAEIKAGAAADAEAAAASDAETAEIEAAAAPEPAPATPKTGKGKGRKGLIAVAAVAVIGLGAFGAGRMFKNPKDVVITAFENIYTKDQTDPLEELFGFPSFGKSPWKVPWKEAVNWCWISIRQRRRFP